MSEAERPALSVHHVGGRTGTRGFPTYDTLEPDLVNVLYEADPAAIEQMRRRVAERASVGHVVCACLGEREGRSAFNLYRSGYHSSLYELDPRVIGYSFDPQFAWDVDPAMMSIDARPSIDLVTLDGFLARSGEAIPPPDYLSLDTQGSELDILRGGEATLAASVLAVQAEVTFSSIYLEQPLFGEVARHLDQRGFILADLEVFPMEGRAATRLPVGLRGRGYAESGEALFLRRPETLGASSLQALKLAFLNFLFGYVDKCFEQLQRLRAGRGDDIDRLYASHGGRYRYLRVLKELETIPGRSPQLLPPTQSEVLHGALAQQRFEWDAPPPYDYPGLWARYFAHRDLAEVQRQALALLTPDDTPLEQVCRDHGFADLHAKLRQRRTEQAIASLMQLGALVRLEGGRYEFRWQEIAAALQAGSR